MGLHHMPAWLKRTLRAWPRLMITATKEVEAEAGQGGGEAGITSPRLARATE